MQHQVVVSAAAKSIAVCLTNAEHLMLLWSVLTCVRRLSSLTLLRYRPGSRCRRWSG